MILKMYYQIIIMHQQSCQIKKKVKYNYLSLFGILALGPFPKS